LRETGSDVTVEQRGRFDSVGGGRSHLDESGGGLPPLLKVLLPLLLLDLQGQAGPQDALQRHTETWEESQRLRPQINTTTSRCWTKDT